uniref:Ras-GEF domain-containing protein n=1 Tax=Wuchereria bancrofti TaxID=6293 RepID=A0A1I8EAX6_WUCBA
MVYCFRMFESPFKSDFDFGTEFVSSTQHPFSLRSRLREVRDAFRGFRPSPDTVPHSESKLPAMSVRRASDTATSSIKSSNSPSLPIKKKKPVKEIEVSIQFLYEVIRTDMFEVLIGSASAVFDSVLSYISTLKYPAPCVQAIAEVDEKSYESSPKPENVKLFGFHQGQHNTSVTPNNSGFHSISSADITSPFNHSSGSIGEEEREEKKDTKTCEEEVQRLSDGSEIRTRKTRTFNMLQNSKQVTVRSHGNGGDEIVNTFHDGNTSFNDDLATDDFFTTPRNSFGRNRLDRDKCLDDLLKTKDDSTNPDEGISQKIKSVQHTDTVSQKVSKTAKKNGKVIADDAAQKIDRSELNARQVETFKDVKLLDRRGSGSYEEHSTVKMGLTKLSSPPPIPPKQRHVIQYMQTFGNKSENQDDFFKGSTLASYILLNDNLRYHEEQYKKRISFEFSLSRAAVSSQHYSDLNQLLQYSETDRIMLPKRYMDENEIVSKGTTSLAPSETSEILECVDVTDWLMLRAHDALSKPNEVRGGPKDALIAFATQPSGSLLYQEAFLTTYRSFVESDELIQKLIRRYLYMCTIKEQQSVKVARQTFSMLVRVVDELCAVEQTRKLIRVITKFISRLVKDENYTFARILRKRLMSRMDLKSIQKLTAASKERTNMRGVSSRHLTIFDIRSAIIAKQMTYLDAELFHMIEPAEMLWWAQEQNEKKSPNLCRFTEHFNKVSYWVRTLVLTPCEQRTREKVMTKFVKIMKHLRIVGNYNSYLAILSALDSGPIRRLDWSKHITDLLKEHSIVMDSSHSFKNYRTLLGESRPPCLPYIGLVLQDLTFVHIGNSDYLPPEQSNGRKNLLNYGKRWQQFAILDSIRCFKSWNYSIEKDEKVIQFFNGFNNYLSEDEIWDLSESIKPRTRKNK